MVRESEIENDQLIILQVDQLSFTLTAPRNCSINVIGLIHKHDNSTSISTPTSWGDFPCWGIPYAWWETSCKHSGSIVLLFVIQAIYVLIQKRFIFNRRDCKFHYMPASDRVL